jgi:mono/diheme cytochrome c family protein
MLKPSLKWFLLSFAAVLFVIAAASTPSPTLAAGRMPQATAEPAKQTQVSSDKAKKMYAIDCAVCHGETGDGKTDLAKDMSLTMPDWTDPKTLAGKSDQELFDIIRKGKDKMPAEDAGRAKDPDVWGLVAYIRVLAKAQPAAPAAPAAPANN